MKRMRAIGVIMAAVIASGVVYAMVAIAGETKPAAKITQSDVDTEVLARALNLQIYAFEIPIPTQESTLSVWMERWTREVNEPQVFQLFTALGLVGEGSGKLTVCLPTTNHPESLAVWSTRGGKAAPTETNITSTPFKSAISGGAHPSQAIDMKDVTGTTFIEPRAMVLSQDIPLMALQYNKSGISQGLTEHIEKDNDVTWYLRVRFTPGKANRGIIAWKDGKIEIQ